LYFNAVPMNDLRPVDHGIRAIGRAADAGRTASKRKNRLNQSRSRYLPRTHQPPRENAMPDTVERAVFKIVIRGTIEAVWREITKTDSAQQCFFNMCLHTPGLKIGSPIQMRTRSGKYVGVIGKVLEFDPPRRYAHTFRFTNLDDPECKVIYELKEVPDGVEFVMTLEDMPAGERRSR
jgi:hypothetical protein